MNRNPASHLGLEEAIGRITYTDYAIDGLGQEVGRLWAVGSEHFGRLGDDYREMTSLAAAMAKTPNLRARVVGATSSLVLGTAVSLGTTNAPSSRQFKITGNRKVVQQLAPAPSG